MNLRVLFSLLAVIFPVMYGYSQAPSGINYQAVARSDNALLTNQTLDVKFSVLRSGNIMYQELHSVATNEYGLFSTVLGEGIIISGDFGLIDWGNGEYFLKVEVDAGNGFINMGSSRLVSVPYSLYAQKAETVDSLSILDLTDVDGESPSIGNVLKWNGIAWAPANDNVAVGGGAVNTSARIQGDGTPTNPLDLAPQGATAGQVLKWDGTNWIPANDDDADGDADPANELQTLSLLGNILTLSGSGGSVNLPGKNYNPGPGISISGSIISNTGDLNPLDDIVLGTGAGGDLSGSFPNPKVSRIQNNAVSASIPFSGEVLKFIGGQWQPSPDETVDSDSDPNNEIQSLTLSGMQLTLSDGGGTVNLPSYIGGPGINITGNVIANTGDNNPLDDITSGSAALGDLSGAFPGPVVARIQGNPVSANNPTQGQVLKWLNGQWKPSGDAVNDNDSNPTNEIQSLSLTGTVLSLSDGGGSVNLPTGVTYSAGNGMNLTGTVFSNTGDVNPNDDITIGMAANGDLSGAFPSPVVSRIQGKPVAGFQPVNGDVLKWNGFEWAPAQDIVGSTGATPWQEGSSHIFYNSGNIHIGDTTPVSAGLAISINSTDALPHLELVEKGNDFARLSLKSDQGPNPWIIAGLTDSVPENELFMIKNGSPESFLEIDGRGNVGVGTAGDIRTRFHVGNKHWVLFGKDTTGTGIKMFWSGSQGAFRAGGLTGTSGDFWNEDSLGTYSFAAGMNNRAKGLAAMAVGRDVVAEGNYSFAGGYLTRTNATYSVAFGAFSQANGNGSLATGYSAKTGGNYSLASGYFTETAGSYSVALGHTSIASGTAAFASGLRLLADAYASAAFGRYNVGGGSATGWISTDPLFEIGNGSNNNNRNNALTVLKGGNVGINIANPLDILHVNGRIRMAGVEYFEDGGSNTISAYGTLEPAVSGFFDLGDASRKWRDVYATNGTIITSDLREKENIEPLNYGLEQILALKPVRFTWRQRPEEGYKIGLIAQEVSEVVSEVVKTHTWVSTEDGGPATSKEEMPVMGMYIADLIPVLIRGMQEQQEEIESLKAELEAQKSLIEKLVQEKR